MLPFAVLVLSYRLVGGSFPTFEQVLGRGELFIPSSIMNAEAIWICKYLDLPGRSVWYPIIIATCSLAALGGAICFGITAALVMAPHPRVEVAPLALRQLARDVTVLSAGEFLLALLVGTLGVTLFMLSGGQEEPSHE